MTESKQKGVNSIEDKQMSQKKTGKDTRCEKEVRNKKNGIKHVKKIQEVSEIEQQKGQKF